MVLDHKMGLCREEEGTEPRGVAEGGQASMRGPGCALSGSGPFGGKHKWAMWISGILCYTM